MFQKILFLFVSVFMISSSATETLIPRDVIFGNPEKTMARISPNGKYISYLAPENGVLNLWIAPKNNLKEAEVITQDTKRGIRQYFWSYNPKYILYLQDFKGDENFRLYSYNLETKKTTLLSPESDVKTVVYGASIDAPNKLLIGLNTRDKEHFDVYLLNLKDSSLSLILENHEYAGFIADNDLNIRFGIRLDEVGDEEIFAKKGDDWTLFTKIPMEDAKNTSIVGFNKKNDSLYLLDTRGTNTAILKLLDLKTEKVRVIAQDPKADLEVFMIHPTQKTIQAIEVDYDKPLVQVLDPSIQKDIDLLKTFHKGHFVVSSRSLDDTFWIVTYLSDLSPPSSFIYDRAEGKVNFLFNNNPTLAKEKLAPMHPVMIKSRDGLDLVSYLTLPNTSAKLSTLKKPLPMVLFVHGGPWARDSWGLNPVHQWLANRGYAVMSVNYRGSTGFGKDFVNAGNMEWSGKMHDDLIDAVNWAVSKKIADPKKIGIMGGSYGGYATLVGLTFTPDLFACGVDIVGPSNLVTLLNSFPPYWKPIMNDMKKRVGTSETEEGIKELEKRSPLTFVDKISKPLLIAQGAFDPRVKQPEADQIVEAMQKNGIPVIYALYPTEGHGFAVPNNRISFYAMTEVFLSDILGGNVEPIGDDFKGADFVLNGVKNPSSEMASEIIEKNIKKKEIASSE